MSKPVPKQKPALVKKSIAERVASGNFWGMSIDDLMPDKKIKYHKQPTLGDVWKKSQEDLSSFISGKWKNLGRRIK